MWWLVNWTKYYFGYYIANLITNFFLLSYYIVIVASHHLPCKTKSGYNITQNFDFVFVLGLVIVSADFFNSAIPCIWFRAKLRF